MLIFAILYLIGTISSIVYFVVSLLTWDFDGDVSVNLTVVDEDKEEEVEVSEGAIVGLSVGIHLVFVLIRVYFAACLFSLYYQLKNKKEAQRRDAEMAFVGKNTSYIVELCDTYRVFFCACPPIQYLQ